MDNGLQYGVIVCAALAVAFFEDLKSKKCIFNVVIYQTINDKYSNHTLKVLGVQMEKTIGLVIAFMKITHFLSIAKQFQRKKWQKY